VSSSTGAAPAVLTEPPSGNGTFAPGGFKFTIPGVQSTQVLRVESFVVGQGAGPATASQVSANGPFGVTSLLVTIAPSTAPDWIAWLDSSVKNGPGPTTEKTFTLEFMTSQATRLATIQGTGVGIVALRNMLDGSNAGVIQAELYARQLQLLP
jgi:hypothetical protein